MSTPHPFDRALALEPDENTRGLFTAHTTPEYWNMVGPFGGITTAVVLQSVLEHPDLLGAPISLTVNFAAAVGEGAFKLLATPVRTNRSTQHWTVTVTQRGADGIEHVTTTATAVTAVRRETWSENDLPMPQAPAPDTVAPRTMGVQGIAWVNQYDMRMIHGNVPAAWDGGGTHSETRMWARDIEPRPIDYTSLVSMSDMFYPRVWLRRAKPVPAGTVSITVYLHADAAQMAEVGTGFLLAQARGQRFCNGFFDQTAQLWSEAGTLLATSHQIVYYKE